MTRVSPPPARPATPRPGPNPLFWASLVALALAGAAGAFAGDATVVRSNLVYRLIVGSIVFAVGYGVIAVFWHAWHRRTLAKIGIGPASAEAPEQPVSQELSERDREIQQFMEAATKAVSDLDERLSRQELEPRTHEDDAGRE